VVNSTSIFALKPEKTEIILSRNMPLQESQTEDVKEIESKLKSLRSSSTDCLDLPNSAKNLVQKRLKIKLKKARDALMTEI
jgi:hypothetical protein